ncbi:hypothetical protein D3C85_1906580 [compost metagenome]
MRPRHGAVHANAARVGVEIGPGQQPLQRHVDKIGIGDVAVAVQERQLHGLDQQVVIVCAAFRDT